MAIVAPQMNLYITDATALGSGLAKDAFALTQSTNSRPCSQLEPNLIALKKRSQAYIHDHALTIMH